MRRRRIEPGPGQESVWDYPRPPRVERVPQRVRVIFNGLTIADTTRALRVLETSSPPVYYIPRADIRMEALRESSGHATFCEWKGRATYYTVQVGERQARHAAWSYRSPAPGYEPIQDHLAFYAGPMDGCFVGEERVQPQAGDFYGGWITSTIVGPFKGEPGTLGW